MRKIGRYFGTFLRSEAGATATEYAVMVALVLLVVLLAIAAMGSKVSDTLDNASNGW